MASLSHDNTVTQLDAADVEAVRSIDPRGLPVTLRPGLSLLFEPRAFVLAGLAVLCYAISSFVGNEWSYLVPASLLASFLLGVLLPFLEVASLQADVKIRAPGEVADARIALKIERREKLSFLSRLVPAGYLGAYVVMARRGAGARPSEIITLPVPTVIDSLSNGFEALLSLPPLRRGVYELQEIRIASCFPFGVSWCVRSIRITSHESPQAVTVYPELHPIQGGFQSKLKPNSEAGISKRQMVHFNHSTNIRGVREFNERDNLTHIHWSVSARTGKLMVREFEPESQADFDVVLDASANWTQEQFELAVSVAWSLIQYGCRMSFQPELFLCPKDSAELIELLADTPGGLAGREKSAELLARVEPLKQAGAPSALHPIAGRALVAVVPDGSDGVAVVEVGPVSSGAEFQVRQNLGKVKSFAEVSRL